MCRDKQVSEEKQYPAMSTYAISDYYRALAAVEKVVDDMRLIKHTCEMLCFWRGDMTGRVYGTSYVGLEEAAKLLPEYERKISAYKEAVAELKKELPEPDFESVYRTPFSENHYRQVMSDNFDKIKQFFDLTHEYYKQYPAPQRVKNTGNNLLALVGLISIVYTVWNLIF